MDDVFLLWHTNRMPDGEDSEKLLGVYRTQADADAALERARTRPGFCDAPDGFEISRYDLNKDEWTFGYVTLTYKPKVRCKKRRKGDR